MIMDHYFGHARKGGLSAFKDKYINLQINRFI